MLECRFPDPVWVIMRKKGEEEWVPEPYAYEDGKAAINVACKIVGERKAAPLCPDIIIFSFPDSTEPALIVREWDRQACVLGGLMVIPRQLTRTTPN